MKQSRRRAFSVTSGLQYKFLAMTVTYGFIIIGLFLITFLAQDVLEMYNHSLSLEVRSVAANRVLVKHQLVWPPMIFVIIALGLHSFLEFQRIIGPLYQFRCAFEQVEKGDLSVSVKMRRKDYLAAEEEAINRMLAALAGKFSVIKKETGEVLKSMSELENAVPKDSEWGANQIELLGAHRRHLERLSAAVDFFRLPDVPQETAVSIQDD